MRKRNTFIRTMIIVGVLIFVMVIYLNQLMQIQIVHGEEYLAKVTQSSYINRTIPAARGEILDRYGRPLAINTIGFSVVFNGTVLLASTDTQDTELTAAQVREKRINETIVHLLELMESADETWLDSLPITESEPFAYREDSDAEVDLLKSTLALNTYATCDQVMGWLVERYALQEYEDTPGLMRKVAGVRYGMELSEFSTQTPYIFAQSVQSRTASIIKERSFELPGVEIREGTIREYVSGDLAPHIIGRTTVIYPEELSYYLEEGYSRSDYVGREGIEKKWESMLRGIDGLEVTTLNANQEVVSVEVAKEPEPGDTVVLTIDSHLQRIAQDALDKQIEWLQNNASPGKGQEADSGAVVVIDVKSGDILAIATSPRYNIGTYQQDYSELSQDELKPLFDRALNGVYRPGSTFKPVVGVGALSEGIITPNDTVNCNRVYTFYEDFPVTCMSAHGFVNVYHALRVSCNIFFYDVGRRLTIDNINKYAEAFGFGQDTGVEIDSRRGTLSSPQLKQTWGQWWADGDTLQASIGQLDTYATPLQLATYAATIANRGTRMDVNIVRSVQSYTTGETIYEAVPVIAAQVPGTEEAFDAVIQGMVLASGPTGTASATFGSYPLTVASKTGTPEGTGRLDSVFITFAPAQDPQIAIAVVIEQGYHGYTGAPVARDIYNAYFFSEAVDYSTVPQGTLLK